MTSRQRYLVTCSAAATVHMRVAAIVRAGKSHLALVARTLTLNCKARKSTEATASFTLSSAAKQLLARHGASVKLSVRAYASASAGGKPLASATLHGSA
jgi:hypothetical protein